MAIAVALPGFNDLGRSVTPTTNSRFLSTGHRILLSCGCKARETMVAKYKLGL